MWLTMIMCFYVLYNMWLTVHLLINTQICQDLIHRMVKLVRDFDKLDTNVSVLFFQKAAELAAMGVTGPEGHEMCRPEEVRFVFPHCLGSLFLLYFVQQLVCFFPLPFQFLIAKCSRMFCSKGSGRVWGRIIFIV